ncbi:hypothetical protein [Streptomyces acidiscabies]|uniref:hypothetical protein n=1 Tax=Streptomyces acidiscabies TaxID=42234 RepID=UPI0038F727C4
MSQFAPIATTSGGDGGYRLTGKWAFVSCSHQAQWTLTAFRMMDDVGQPREALFALVPADDLTIEDTWCVTAMVV